MNKGEWLQRFFAARGYTHIKDNGEMDVCCPFIHDKGYETRPSAHINTEEGVFHCKTCKAEGRFSNGGLSELGFIAEWYSMPYEDAVLMVALQSKSFGNHSSYDEAVTNMLGYQEGMDFLIARGIDESMVREYQLGYTGDGVIYPVFVDGELLDKRTYNLKWKEEKEANPGKPVAKIKSESGAKNYLYPYDHWFPRFKADEPTFLLAGENDTLLGRKYGYNAITSTFGEGSFPKLFLGLFKGKKVYVVYDCDKAGKKGGLTVAFLLKEAGADVYIVDLGLSGGEDDKDVTDFFITHGYTKDDFQARVDAAIHYDGEMYAEAKNMEYPLVDLWDVPEGKYSGKRISSRAIMMGKFSTPMETPTAVNWACRAYNPDSKACATCNNKNKEGWWTLDEKNLNHVLELIEVNAIQRDRALKKYIGIPDKCPGVRLQIASKKHVNKVIFSPDVDTEDELSGFKAADQIAYVIGLSLDDGQRYRIFFKRYAHPLDDQKIVTVVDRVEESDNPVNSFRMSDEIKQELSQFQGNPFNTMAKRYEHSKLVVGPFANEMVVHAVDVIYHSVLDFKFANGKLKGHPEGLIVGPSRTGKTDTALKLQQFYGLGNFTECKAATVAGLLGGADKLPSGEYKTKWGVIPRNHKGLLVLDELSGMQKEVMAKLTGLRSRRVATIEKITGSGRAPAKTRMLWISNPRVQADGKSLNIADYPNGVKIILDLIGSDEDIARFDFVVILPNIEAYSSPFTKEKLEEMQNPAYRHLIQWIWSRKEDQVKFSPGVEEYIWQLTQELNEQYDTDIKFFGSEAWKKLARIAVSVAGMCFSNTDEGESILVTKEHADWARDFLIKCYDNDIFRLPEYVQQSKLTTTTNQEVNDYVAGLIHAQPMLMKKLKDDTDCSMRTLQAVSGLEPKIFNDIINGLMRNGLVTSVRDSIQATRRFRLAINAYRETQDKQRLKPLSEMGGSLI